MNLLSVIGGAIKPVTDLIDSLHTSEEEKIKAKAALMDASKEIELGTLEYAGKLAEHRAKIILSETQGGWLQRNWRPILMMTAIVIIANNYIFFPYASIWTEKVAVMELPDGLWTLLSLGVTGYVVGRSAEKAVEKWKDSSG